jgi:hypothetical protein
LNRAVTFYHQMKRAGTALVLAVAAVAAAAPTAAGQSHSLSIAANPQNVRFGNGVFIFGQLTGPNSAGETVDLQANPAGGNQAFDNIATSTTDAGGNYIFGVTPAGNTVYRARARTSPRTDSFEFIVGVIPRASLGVTDSTPRAGQVVTFYGAIRPAHDGMQVQIQRHTSSGWVTVRMVTLLNAPPEQGRSVWSKNLRVNHDGTYRVIFPAHEDHKTAKSRTRSLNAH